MTATAQPAPKIFMIVDDDAEDRDILCYTLNTEFPNCRCISASDGLEASAKLDPEQLPDLIFLDMQMPRMNGIEFLRQIKAKEVTKYIPVVMYSSYQYPADIDQANRLGAADYIMKHASPDKLLKLVREIMRLSFQFKC